MWPSQKEVSCLNLLSIAVVKTVTQSNLGGTHMVQWHRCRQNIYKIKINKVSWEGNGLFYLAGCSLSSREVRVSNQSRELELEAEVETVEESHLLVFSSGLAQPVFWAGPQVIRGSGDEKIKIESWGQEFLYKLVDSTKQGFKEAQYLLLEKKLGQSQQKAKQSNVAQGKQIISRVSETKHTAALGLITSASSGAKAMVPGIEMFTPLRPRPKPQIQTCQVWPWAGALKKALGLFFLSAAFYTPQNPLLRSGTAHSGQALPHPSLVRKILPQICL